MTKGDYFFPLYYQRLLTSTLGWKDEEFGAYVKLLIYQFDNGYVPDDIEEIGRIAPAAKKNWGRIGKKFIKKDGVLINLVMDGIRNKRNLLVESSKENGRKGGRPKKKKENPEGNLNETRQEPDRFLKQNLNKRQPYMVNGLMDNGSPEGGVGEVENSLNWETEKQLFVNDEQWIYQFCQGKKITKARLEVIRKKFLTDLELKQDYKPLDELRSHFVNWYNKNVKSFEDTDFVKQGGNVRDLQEEQNRKILGL